MKIKFKPFLEGNESGKFICNPYWLEYLLCLFSQGYLGEVWEEITDTKINQNQTIENIGYGIIGNNMPTKEDIINDCECDNMSECPPFVKYCERRDS